jgi:hypothetical protein
MQWNDYYENGLCYEMSGFFHDAINAYIAAIEVMPPGMEHTTAALYGRIHNMRNR